MPYTKTIWAEDTPITTALLNKMENGIEAATKDALPITGGTLTGSITLPNSTKGQIKQTLSNGTTTPTLYITTNDNLRVGSADIENVCIYTKTNPKTSVSGTTYTLYHTGNKPTLGELGALAANSPSFTGNLIQVGPSGKDWVYHINADRGSLHMAPHNNGNNDWNNQIYFERNGQIYCNGGKRVPTMDGNNPAHYMFRYGSGLGGANGYITFSYQTALFSLKKGNILEKGRTENQKKE